MRNVENSSACRCVSCEGVGGRWLERSRKSCAWWRTSHTTTSTDSSAPVSTHRMSALSAVTALGAASRWNFTFVITQGRRVHKYVCHRHSKTCQKCTKTISGKYVLCLWTKQRSTLPLYAATPLGMQAACKRMQAAYELHYTASGGRIHCKIRTLSRRRRRAVRNKLNFAETTHWASWHFLYNHRI